MSNFSPSAFKILFNNNWATTGLAKAIAAVDRNALCREYDALVQCAPRRSGRSKCYFVGHAGTVTQSIKKSNRGEEHLAIALWNLKGGWPRPDGSRFRLLDYQFPLKAGRSDRGVGKIDLLGVTDSGRIMVIELKVERSANNDRGDTPALALMEGLRYAAIVYANRSVIVAEAKSCFNVKIADEPPIVQILAPMAWWKSWLNLGTSTRAAAGCWEPEFTKLARDIEQRVGVAVECMALDGLVNITYETNKNTPQLAQAPTFRPVRPDENPPIGDVLSPHQSKE